MDKLINYIQFREKKYGVIKGIASVNSMYYQIGVYMVRISEHMKYSESAIKDCDYFFIIQPNDTYIFITNPKYNKDGKMYMKIVSYNDAKEFIKSLDEFAGKFIKMTDWYHPENWNRNVKDKGKLSWDEFERIYMRNISDEKKFGVVNRIESLVFGSPKRGNLKTKLPGAIEAYNNMTSSQYNALIKKMEG